MAFEINDIFLNLTLPLLAIFLTMITLIITFYFKISGVKNTLTKIETYTSSIPDLSLRIERLLALTETHRSVNVKLHDIDITISPVKRSDKLTVVSFFLSEDVVDKGLLISMINKEKWNLEFEKQYGDSHILELSKHEFYVNIQTDNDNILVEYLQNFIKWIDNTYIPLAKKWKEDFEKKLSDSLK